MDKKLKFISKLIYKRKEFIYLLKNILIIYFTFAYMNSTSAETNNVEFECNTSVILSINKKGELKQFLPGKIYFEINKNTLIFGKLGYITDEEIIIKRINDNKFYSYQPAQTILYENGLFHNVIFTYEGITAIQAKCLPLKDLNLKE
tara:strand:- start:162 stop:602 length:441 start_codon:yes stop_codon:yes gene_type:complete